MIDTNVSSGLSFSVMLILLGFIKQCESNDFEDKIHIGLICCVVIRGKGYC